MVDPEHVDSSPAPAFGPGAAHLRATVSAASQLRPRSFGGLCPPIADRTGVQQHDTRYVSTDSVSPHHAFHFFMKEYFSQRSPFTGPVATRGRRHLKRGYVTLKLLQCFISLKLLLFANFPRYNSGWE